MKIIVTAAGDVFGPFSEVMQGADRLIAEGREFPYSVIGIDFVVQEQGDWQPPSAPEPVPAAVSPRQIRQALTRADLRDAVETAVAAGDQDLRDWWEFATAIERHHPQVVALAASLGVSDDALDNLFRLAGSL